MTFTSLPEINRHLENNGRIRDVIKATKALLYFITIDTKNKPSNHITIGDND